MNRLFLALGLHEEAVQELVRLQSHLPAGGRVAQPDQMHLTLHFLGQAEIGPVESALREVSAASVALEIASVGHFQSPDGAVTVWVGVKLTEELRRLHAATAAALVTTGFHAETRPYHPHVTLARFKRGVSGTDLADFLGSHGEFFLAPVPIAEFTLYSSELTPLGPVYRRERTFALR